MPHCHEWDEQKRMPRDLYDSGRVRQRVVGEQEYETTVGDR